MAIPPPPPPLQLESSQHQQATEHSQSVLLEDLTLSRSDKESDVLQFQHEDDSSSSFIDSVPVHGPENDALKSLKDRGYSEDDGKTISEIGKKLGIVFNNSVLVISDIQAVEDRDRALISFSSKRKRITSPIHHSEQVRLRKRLGVRRVSK